MRRVLIFLSFCLCLVTQAQNRYVDSVIRVYPKQHDTVKVQILCTLSRFYESNDPNKAIQLADSALKLASKIKYENGIAGSLGHRGSSLCTAGKYDESIKDHLQALKIYEARKQKRSLTNTYNSLANAYMGLGNNEKARDYFLKAYEMADKEPKDEYMKAIAGFGVGNMYVQENAFKEAIKYYQFAEKFFHDHHNPNYEAMAQTALGDAFERDSNFVEAEKYYSSALAVFRKLNDEYGLALSLASIGSVEANRKNYRKAVEYYREALQINLQRKAWDNIQNSALRLAQLYEELEQPAEALKTFKIYMQYKDSVINTERNKAIADAESKYESEKKEQQLQLQNSELEKTKLKVEQRNHLIYIFAGTGLVFLVLLFFVYKEFREKKKANRELIHKNEEIALQKALIEEKNKDITDSINYARHIQQSIIPSAERVKSYLPKSFVLFKPKDIVSGDFYMVEEVVGVIYLAVVDCTGHGVPGAMLSVFANSIIRNTIASNEFRENPAAILSDLCFQFKTNLQSHNTSISIADGVDMAICLIDQKKNKIYFAGAKNGLMMLRNGEIQEFQANRWGISGGNKGEHMFFNNYEIDVKTGDKFYLTTDGFYDQFGGPKGKKLKQKQLKDLLVSYKDLGFDDQAQKLNRDFEDWKGKLEQIDDVTIIGFEL